MHTIHQLLADHFRCPRGDVEFDWPPAEQSSHGYCRFGDDVVCYAQSRDLPLARTANGPLYDALKDVRLKTSRCVLPFDPVHVIENLRFERYVGTSGFGCESHAFQRLIRAAYYGGRPFLPVPLRKHLQRLFLAGRPNRRFPEWPVDRTVDRLLEKLLALSLKAQGLERIPFIWFWPDGHSCAAMMTHDVETSAGLMSCSDLMDLDEEYGIRSSFQVIPEGRYRTPQSLLHDMRQRGFEINVHDLNHDGRLYWQQGEFLRRTAKINRHARQLGANGFRAGVLYRNVNWYDAFEFSYDMSVPNVGHLGPQAGGCCTVMPYFVGRILELPVTTTEDYQLFEILGEYSLDPWVREINLIREGHGLVSFIAHPDYLVKKRARITYASLLAELARLRSQAGLWIALPGEVNEWWRARSQMRLVQHNGDWRIEGPGCERARIAYANLDPDGNLHYSVEASPVIPDTTSAPTLQPTLTETGNKHSTPENSSPGASTPDSVPSGLPPSVQSPSPGRSAARQHAWFALLCVISGIVFWGPLGRLFTLAYHSDYYSHTAVIPLLAGCLVYLERKKTFADSRPSLGMGIPLLFAGVSLFVLQNLGLGAVGQQGRLSLAIFAVVLFWTGGFALCYGERAFRSALFPMLLLLLTVPLPMAAMDSFIHVTRVGSAEVASAIFQAFHVPVFRDGYLFVLPGLSIEVAKECSGIHSTIALFILTLMAGYLYLRSSWKTALLLLFAFPIVSLTNGIRIATLTLLAEYADRNILGSSLHRDGGVLFFLLALSLMLIVMWLISKPHKGKRGATRNKPHAVAGDPGDVHIPLT